MAKREPTVGSHQLEMDGEWGLLELSGFGRQYVQVYSMMYALHFGVEEEEPEERTVHAFGAFPWTGGWSAVDFYDSLRIAVPADHRPRIVAMEYASPGYIELAVIAAVALNIRRIVDHVCSIIERANDTYSRLYKAAMKRKLLRVDASGVSLEQVCSSTSAEQRRCRPQSPRKSGVFTTRWPHEASVKTFLGHTTRRAQLKLERDELEFAEEATQRLAATMGFDLMGELERLTENPLVRMKILFSLYRRVRDLARIQRSKRIRF